MGTTLIENRKRGYDPSKLSDQQRVFVLELMGDSEFKPVEAARRAKYKNPNVAAAKLMKKPAIKAILGKFQREREERLQVKADDVLRELISLGFRDVIDLCDEDGMLVIDDMRKIPEGMRRCIDGIKCKQYTDQDGNVTQTIELKLVGKLSALELIGKHLGMFVERKDVSINSDTNWAALLGQVGVVEDDVIEGRIAAARQPTQGAE